MEDLIPRVAQLTADTHAICDELDTVATAIAEVNRQLDELDKRLTQLEELKNTIGWTTSDDEESVGEVSPSTLGG